MTKVISITLPAATSDRVDQLAYAQGQTPADFLAQLLVKLLAVVPSAAPARSR